MIPDRGSDRWWQADPSECFWLEITDRADLGVDLNAPAEREQGGEYWSYAFVREVQDGDVVLHYRARPINAITHWSRAVGDPYRDQVYWGAHGQAGGRGPVAPYWRAGWRHPLDGPYELAEPVTAENLRAAEGSIQAVYDQLRAEHPRASIYFPFQLSDYRPLRAFQGSSQSFRARSPTSWRSFPRYEKSPLGRVQLPLTPRRPWATTRSEPSTDMPAQMREQLDGSRFP